MSRAVDVVALKEAVTAVQRQMPEGWTAIAYHDGQWEAIRVGRRFSQLERVRAATSDDLLRRVKAQP